MNKLVDTDIAVTTTTTAQNNDTDNHNTNNDGSKNKNARNKNNNRTTEDSSRKRMEQEQDDPKKPKIRQVTEIISQVRKTGQHPPEWKLRPPREHECIAHGSDKQVPQGSPPSPRISMLLQILLANLRNYFRGMAPPPCRHTEQINIEMRGCGGRWLQSHSLHLKF